MLTIIQGTMDAMDRILPSAFPIGCVESHLVACRPFAALAPFVFFSAVFSSRCLSLSASFSVDQRSTATDVPSGF